MHTWVRRCLSTAHRPRGLHQQPRPGSAGVPGAPEDGRQAVARRGGAHHDGDWAVRPERRDGGVP
eukprot:129635-Chlamydomonas_euryale.AAC.1